MKRKTNLLISLVLALSLLFGTLSGCTFLPDKENDLPDDTLEENDVFDTSRVTFLSAYTEAQKLGFEGSLDEFIALISGKDGKDGVGISRVLLDSNGVLVIVLTNGETVDLGKIKGEDGKDGAPGEKGEDGKDGASIKSVELDAEGRLVITLTDGTVLPPVEIPEKGGHAHTFEDWKPFVGNTDCVGGLFYHICTECKAIEWESGDYSHHAFSTVTVSPTCSKEGYDEKTCTLCGFVTKVNYTPKDATAHSISEQYTFDDTYHWFECDLCDGTTAKEKHTIDKDGFCTLCDCPISSTPGLLYIISGDKTCAYVSGYEGTETDVIIAQTYEGLPVKSVFPGAFQGKGITSVIIPEGVTGIGEDAFAGCTSLKSVALPDTLTSIEARAFLGCTQLTEIVIQSNVEYISYIAFNSGVTIKYCGTEEEWKAIKSEEWQPPISEAGFNVIYSYDGE